MASKVQIERYKPDQIYLASEAPPDSNVVELRVVDVSSAAYAALRTSLQEHGQIVPVVYQRVGQDRYVISGNHRLCALRELGADVLAVDVETLGGDPLEVALADQIIRSPLHPVDQFEAFSILRDDGMDVGDIAHRFSITAKEVTQALALATLAPEVRDAWRAGRVTEAVAQAFTMERDHKRQGAVLKALDKEGWLSDAWRVRREIVGDRGEHSALLAFVGADAYRARGGEVVEDLFGDKHAISDPALLKAISGGKLDAACVSLLREGWAWAVHGAEAAQRYTWRRQTPEPEKATKEEAARIKAIRKRQREINEFLNGEEAATQESIIAMEDEGESLADEERDIESEQVRRAFTPEMRAKCGCVVEIGGDGRMEVYSGYVRGKAPADKTPGQRKKAAAKKADAGEVSNALQKDLDIWLRSATKIALQRCAHSTPGGIAACAIATVADLIRPESYTNPLSGAQMEALRASAPTAIMIAASRDAFDAESYFSRIPKANLVAIAAEAVNADEAARVGKMKSDEAQKWAVANVVPTGWLPPQMRTDGYALLTPGGKPSKPAKVKPKAKRK